jgi:hypothetical protein
MIRIALMKAATHALNRAALFAVHHPGVVPLGLMAAIALILAGFASLAFFI